MSKWSGRFLGIFFASCLTVAAIAQTIPSGAAIDAEVKKIMTSTHAKGMAVGVVDHGKVGYVQACGLWAPRVIL